MRGMEAMIGMEAMMSAEAVVVASVLMGVCSTLLGVVTGWKLRGKEVQALQRELRRTQLRSVLTRSNNPLAMLKLAKQRERKAEADE